MQMVMMVFRTSLESEVLPWVEEEGLTYTRIDGVQGTGDTGSVPGSVTWGGANSVLFLALSDDRLTPFRDRIRRYQLELERHPRTGGVPFHIFVLPCIQWL